METEAGHTWFRRCLRAALISLYDPSTLRDSPLAALFGVDQRAEPVSALRHVLIDGIESLRPNESTPEGSKTWRVYQVLRRRYTEQLTQREVAADLGLSIRQLQREEKLARKVLADHLWTIHDLETKRHDLTSTLAQAGDHGSSTDERIPTRTRELEWLRNSVPAQMTDVEEVIQEALETIAPLLKSSGASVGYTAQKNLPRIPLQSPMLRQALLNILSTAIRCVPGGQVRIEPQALPRRVYIHVRAFAHHVTSPRLQDYTESLEMAERLIHLCQGSLEITPCLDEGPVPSPAEGPVPSTAEGPVPSTAEGPVPSTAEGPVFTARVTLTAMEQATVLVIDDNADALQLFQRYLSGSRYRFTGAQDAHRGLALAEELVPQVIVLDVMLSKEDGWTLLGQLREHPRTRGIPVIVCTILSQEQLALALGAADFMRKPVSRTELLSALDRQLDLRSREPG